MSADVILPAKSEILIDTYRFVVTQEANPNLGESAKGSWYYYQFDLLDVREIVDYPMLDDEGNKVHFSEIVLVHSPYEERIVKISPQHLCALKRRFCDLSEELGLTKEEVHVTKTTKQK